MKRIAALVLAVLTLAFVFASCGKEFECDLCGETKKGKQYTEEMFGAKITYCADCKEDLEEVQQGLEDIGDQLGGLFDDEK